MPLVGSVNLCADKGSNRLVINNRSYRVSFMQDLLSATEFKAKCLAKLDEVAATRRDLVITKHGKPVAKLVPVDTPGPVDSLAGSVTFLGDVVGPMHEEWGSD